MLLTHSSSESLDSYLQRQQQLNNSLTRMATDAENQYSAQATSREILQQPWTWRHTAGLMRNRAEGLRRWIDISARPSLILAGAGTSDYVGKSAQDFLRAGLKLHVDARPTTDIVVRPNEVFAADGEGVLISFARSGNSPESLEAMRIGLECYPRMKHLVMTCNPDGQLAQLARSRPDRAHLITLHEATNDQGLAMTSSYSSMVVAALGMGHLWQNPTLESYVNIIEWLAKAGESLLVRYSDFLHPLAAEKFDRVFYLGNGTLEGAAIESALKIQELTVGKTIAQGGTFLAFRHGPISAITDRSLIVYYLSSDPHRRRYEMDVIRQLRAPATTLLVCEQCPESLRDCVDGVIECDSQAQGPIPDSHKAPLYVMVGQLLGLFSSLAFGLKPDNPPGASGSYSRVVQGVPIYEYRGS
ncbi:SIS domain-containing protein [Candidatus Poribacteria bacterium]|nr:SIS domain-containing protein [Candidatus Poribacteria bacterium]